MSLRFAVLIPAMAVFVLAGLLGGWLAGMHAGSRAQAQMLDLARSQALTLAAADVQLTNPTLSLLKKLQGVEVVLAADTPAGPDMLAGTLPADQVRQYFARSYVPAGQHRFTFNGRSYQAFSAPKEGLPNGVVAVLVPEDAITEQSRQVDSAVFSTVAFGSGLVALLIYLLMYRLAGRVLKLREHVQKAREDLLGDEVTPDGDAPHADEIQQLQGDFDALARRLTHLRGQLVRVTRERTTSQLTAAVVHDVRNPLQSLGLTLQMLSAGQLDELQTRQGLELARCEVARLNALCDDLLLVGGNRPMRSTRIDVAQSLSSLTELYRQQATAKNVRINLHMDPRLQVDGDIDMFFRALGNLLRNAIDASPEGSYIKVTAAALQHEPARPGQLAMPQDDKVEIIIHNVGAAFPPEVLSPDPPAFFSSKPAGSGLGLSIVRRVVAAHNATLELTNPQGGGAQVRLLWPKSIAESTSAILPVLPSPHA